MALGVLVTSIDTCTVGREIEADATLQYMRLQWQKGLRELVIAHDTHVVESRFEADETLHRVGHRSTVSTSIRITVESLCV